MLNVKVIFTCAFYTLPDIIGQVLWFHIGCLCVHPSAHLSQSFLLSIRFLFPDDNFIECQWIATKLGMYIDIV